MHSRSLPVLLVISFASTALSFTHTLGTISGYWDFNISIDREDPFFHQKRNVYSQCYVVYESSNETIVFDPTPLITSSDTLHIDTQESHHIFLKNEYFYETCNCSCHPYGSVNQDDTFCVEMSSVNVWNEPYCYDGGHDRYWCNRNFNDEWNDAAGPCCNGEDPVVRLVFGPEEAGLLRITNVSVKDFDFADRNVVTRRQNVIGGLRGIFEDPSTAPDAPPSNVHAKFVPTSVMHDTDTCVTYLGNTNDSVAYTFNISRGSCHIFAFSHDVRKYGIATVLVGFPLVGRGEFHRSGIEYVAALRPDRAGETIEISPAAFYHCEHQVGEYECWERRRDVVLGYHTDEFGEPICDKRVYWEDYNEVVLSPDEADDGVNENMRFMLRSLDSCESTSGTYYVYVRAKDDDSISYPAMISMELIVHNGEIECVFATVGAIIGIILLTCCCGCCCCIGAYCVVQNNKNSKAIHPSEPRVARPIVPVSAARPIVPVHAAIATPIPTYVAVDPVVVSKGNATPTVSASTTENTVPQQSVQSAPTFSNLPNTAVQGLFL